MLDLPYITVPTSSEAELVLRMANKSGIIRYIPGDRDFEIVGKPTDPQKKALEKIRSILKHYGSTGVQECLNKVVFDLLEYVVVYPVEDENKLTNVDGEVLPDALLMSKGSTAHDLAYMVHTDLGEGFLYAVDARTKRRVGEDYVLKNGDIIKVVSTR